MQEEDRHSRAVWLGLTAATAVIAFFLLERLVSQLGEVGGGAGEQQGEKEDRKPPRVVREGHQTSELAVGESQCHKKYSAYCVSDLQPPPLKLNNNSVGAAEEADEVAREGGETVIVSQHEVQHHGHRYFSCQVMCLV